MPRNRVLLVMTILAAMTLIWVFSSESAKKLNPPGTATVVAANREILPSTDSENMPEPEDITRQQQQEQLAGLQRDLLNQQQKLETQNQSLEELKKNQQALIGASSYSPQVVNRDLEIENILDEIADYRQAEEEVNRSAEEALNNQDHAARLARDQVDHGIQMVEQALRNTQNEINFWVLNPQGVDGVEAPQRLEELYVLRTQQQQQLNDLRLQRVNISAQVVNNVNILQSLSERARQELRSSVMQAQNQVFSMRTEMAQAQAQQSQNQGRLQLLRQQISAAERDVEAQAQQVRRLQEEIQKRQRELR